MAANLELEAEEYRELDDKRVLVLLRAHGRGKASGVELGKVHRRERHSSSSAMAP
jgi:hypothetical protein